MVFFPYPTNPGQTHFEGCYRERHHHNCAVAEVERLRADLTDAREIVGEFMSLPPTDESHIKTRDHARAFMDRGA